MRADRLLALHHTGWVTFERSCRVTFERSLTWPDNPNPEEIDDKTAMRFLTSLHRDSAADITAGKPPGTNFDALTAEGRVTAWRFSRGRFEDDPAPLSVQLANPDRYGLPVFWRNPRAGKAQSRPNAGTILSLTAMLRVPYRKTLSEVIARYPAVGGSDFDLVQALFGWAPPEETDTRAPERDDQERSLKSRVRFGFALADATAHDNTTNRVWAATPPRPSFWPYYLRPRDGNVQHPVDYNNPGAVVAGRKRYPVRNGAEQLPTVQGGTDDQRGDRMNSDLTFLRPGVTFTSEIRLHNVNEIELGALVWALTFGQLAQDRGYRHMLGRARTWGYGQIKVAIVAEETRLRYVVPDPGGDGAVDLAAAVAAFKRWVCAGLGVADFDGIDSIRRLLNAAHAPTGQQLNPVLHFPHTGGDPNDAEAIVKGYGEIRKRAQKLGGQRAATEAGGDGFVGLPAYPRKP